jgi:hypothetical protein
VRLKNLVFNSILLGGSTLFALGALELALRAFPQVMSEEARLRVHWREVVADENLQIVDDPQIGFLYPPDYEGKLQQGDVDFTFHTDAHGFRNPGPWPDTAEVVVVGDSWVFGYGVEDAEAWPLLLARGLGSNRLVNLGLVGSSPQQYWRVFDRFGSKLHPEVLLFGFFPANDLEDERIFSRWVEEGSPGNYRVWRAEGGASPAGTALVESSYVLTSLRVIWKNRRGSLGGKTIEWRDGGKLRLAGGLYERVAARAVPGHRDFEHLLELFERIDKYTTERGVRLVMLLFPTKEAVYLPLLGERPDRMVPRFIAELERLGIPYLDMTVPLQARAREGQTLYFEIDGHLNRKGNRALADAVLGYLRDNAKRLGLEPSSISKELPGAAQ